MRLRGDLFSSVAEGSIGEINANEIKQPILEFSGACELVVSEGADCINFLSCCENC